MRRIQMGCFILGLFCAGAARGEISTQDLQVTLDQQLTTILQALDATNDMWVEGQMESASSIAVGVSAEEMQYLQNFWLRLRLPFGFVVPGLVNLQVVPDLELLFKRQVPDGYALYHP